MNQRKGFTLIEILVYIAILSVVISVIVSFLLWSMRLSTKSAAMVEVSKNARRAIEIISYEAREAKSIYFPTTGSSQLSLQTLKYSPQGESGSFIDFYLSDGNIYLKKESQDPIALNTDKVEIISLSFDQISTTTTIPSVRISIGVGYKNPKNLPEYSAFINMTSTVSIRSY